MYIHSDNEKEKAVSCTTKPFHVELVHVRNSAVLDSIYLDEFLGTVK